jgi:hypothetical protein
LMTIGVLFVHVVILQLAATIFSGALDGNLSGQPNVIMALVVGLATTLALLKTESVMKELSFAASTPRAARQISSQFVKSIRTVVAASKLAGKAAGVSGVSSPKRPTNEFKFGHNTAITIVPEPKKHPIKSNIPSTKASGLKTGQTRKAGKKESAE